MAPDAPITGTVLDGLDEDVGEGGHQTADEVEGEEQDGPEAVLDVVAEDPQEQHVEPEVGQAAVQEHRHEDGQGDLLVGEQLGDAAASAASRRQLLVWPPL